MYIAHHLITIDKVFQQRLSAADDVAMMVGHASATASPRLSPAASSVDHGLPHGGARRPHPGGGGGGVDGGKLMDVVAWVKRLGNDNFTHHVNVKKQQLSDHLRAAKGFCLLTDNSHRQFTVYAVKCVLICGNSVDIAAFIQHRNQMQSYILLQQRGSNK